MENLKAQNERSCVEIENTHIKTSMFPRLIKGGKCLSAMTGTFRTIVNDDSNHYRLTLYATRTNKRLNRSER